jgi:Crp-like helix-turn-helix domain
MKRGESAACPDCPATRNGVLAELVTTPDRRCAFRCISVGARQPLPLGWSSGHSLALVRRGIVIRQRVDATGSATAVDAIGPGGAAPLSDGPNGSNAGYAVDDALICMCPAPDLASAVDGGAPTSGHVVGLHRAALDRVERIAEARGRSTALARVAAVLCALADTLSPPRRLDVLPSTLQQRDVAELLALRHESVCRAFGVLERAGTIRRSPGGTHIVDRGLLEAMD